MIERQIITELIRLTKLFKAVAVTGPRQSGKTTLVKDLFDYKPYATLENPDTRNFALTDPRGFLSGFPEGAVLDEIQRTPELFSYLQEILDNSQQQGKFILTGSNNFLLQQSISQSLAGRAAYIQLLPFTVDELENTSWLPGDDDEMIIKGFYPPVYDQQISAVDWSKNYISTYIEKDVRQIKNINDLIVFERFMALLAGRCSQELNLSSIAVETGADVKTIQSWIGILESSFIIFLLKPYHRNFNKTVVKRPKVYFYDTSIVCSLLRIKEKSHLQNHPLRGALFENMVVADILKSRTHSGLTNDLFYWREKSGYEVDILLEHFSDPVAIEVKSGKTITADYFKNLEYFKKLSGSDNSFLLYSGNDQLTRSTGTKVLNWRKQFKNLKQLD
jgi:uncharacterized protein